MTNKKSKSLIRGATTGIVTRPGETVLDAVQRWQELEISIRSIAFANIVDLVSEGEIEGLVDGAKSIYLDDTVLQNDDAGETYNFQNVAFESRTGTQNQTYLPGFGLVENTVTVAAEATFSTPITRTITDADINAVRVVVQFPALFETWDRAPYEGETRGTEVEINIKLQSNGGGYNTVINKFIRGKSTNAYEKAFRVELTGDPPWDIRLERVTADATSLLVQDKTYFKSYTEIIDSKLTYPNSALVALKIDAAQFSNIPRRAYHIKGLKVRVPSNYDAETRVYTGTWDGTFSAPVYTNNPVWCYFDLLTSERYGLGKFITDSQIDIWSLYEISQYVDELVDDGSGGLEPRFSCNIYLQTQEEAYKVLNDMTSIFRGMAYWASGSLSLVQDAPRDAEYLFSNANVVDGVFTYSGASAKARHTVALVTWNDPQNGFKQVIEMVEDQDAVAEYGIITTEVLAVGCTSRGQANRVGRWLLYTEQYESKLVAFKTGTEAAILRPGMVIQIADELVAGTRIGGRIVTATTTAVTIDGDYEFNPEGGLLSVVLTDGTVETKTIISMVGRVVTVSSAFSSAPATPAMWMISTSSLETQTYRVISVIEGSTGEYDIAAMAHNPDKYAAVEDGLELEERSITTLNPILSAPSNLQAEEILFESAGAVRTKATISWDMVSSATSYQLQYYNDNNNAILIPPQLANDIEIFDLTPGTYTFSVVAINSLGRRSQPTTLTQVLYGKVAPPEDVVGFSILPSISNLAILTWDKATDLDVLIGGKVRIRWSPLVGANWNDCVDIIEALSGTATSAQVPLLEGTYLAKFEDSSGNESTNAVSIYTTVPFGNALNAVHTETEDTAFLGRKTNCEVSGTELIITDTSLPATYEFENTVDLGAVYPCRVIAYLDIEGYEVSDLMDSRTELMDDWESFDGAEVGDASVKLFMRTTEDNPTPQVTRSTTGTYFDEYGVMQTAAIDVYRPDYDPANVRTNLLTYSQDFTHANWQFGGSANYTRTADATASPIGSITADSLVVKTGLTSFSTSAPYRDLTKTASAITYTESVYVKDKGAGGVRIRVFFDAAVANNADLQVNLLTGAIISTTSGGTISGATSTITALDNDWYRVTITVTSDSSTIVRTQIFAYDSAGAAFTGDDIRGIYLWGAQLEVASAVTDYIPTTTAAATATTSSEVVLAEAAATNLFLRSEDFTHADWQLGGSSNYTRTANATTAPDGTTTADSLVVVNTVTSFSSSCPSQALVKAASAITYTESVYVKDKGAGGCRMRIYFDASAANQATMSVNLVAGTITSTSTAGTVSGATSTIQALPNNWYRISLTVTSDTSIIIRTQIFAYDSAGASFTGDGVKGIYLWGAQLEAASAASTYIPTTTAAVTRGAETITSSPDWTDWKPFWVGEYSGRGFEFKTTQSVVDTSHNVAIKELEVVIDMPDRTETQTSITSGAGTYNAVFTYTFWDVPGIIISAHNMATGDYYTITSQTASGFSIVFRNSAAVAVSRNFDFIAKGYGRELP